MGYTGSVTVENGTGGFELFQWSLARLETQKRGGELGDAATKMIFSRDFGVESGGAMK